MQPFWMAIVFVSGVQGASGMSAALPQDAVRAQAVVSQNAADNSLEQQGWEAYERGDFRGAIAQWQRVAHGLAQDRLGQARVMGQISLAHQRQGDWNAAQGALEISRSLLTPPPSRRPQPQIGAVPETLVHQQIWAQILEAEAQLAGALGQTLLARDRWQAAAQRYANLGQWQDQWRCQLSALALGQRLETPQKTLQQLEALRQAMGQAAHSPELSEPRPVGEAQAKAEGKRQPLTELEARRLQQQAIAHWRLGQLASAQALLAAPGFVAAQTSRQTQAQTELLRGHLAQAQGELEEAIAAYRQALQNPSTQTAALQGWVHLHLLNPPSAPLASTRRDPPPQDQEPAETAPRSATLDALWEQLQQRWQEHPPSRAQLSQRMALIQHWVRGRSLSSAERVKFEALAYRQIQQAYGLGEPGAIAESLATLAWVHSATAAPQKALLLIEEARSQLRPTSPGPSFSQLRYRLHSQEALIQLQIQLVQLAELEPQAPRHGRAESAQPSAPKLSPKSNPEFNPELNPKFNPKFNPESTIAALDQAQSQLQQLRNSSEAELLYTPSPWAELEHLHRQLLEAIAQPQPDLAGIRAIATQIHRRELSWQFQATAQSDFG